MVNIDYRKTDLKIVLEISRIVTIHYFEYAGGFSFEGEKHDFWEFICVDRGEVNITAGSRKITLHKDEIAFHQPMEFHAVHTPPRSAPNIIVVSFVCDSPAMDHFRGKIFHIDSTEKLILADLIREARLCFENRLDDPYLPQMTLRTDQEPWNQQMLQISLLSFLLHLLQRTGREQLTESGRQPTKGSGREHIRGSGRDFKGKTSGQSSAKLTTRNSGDLQFAQVTRYLSEHLGETMTVEKICSDNLLSRSRLFALFRRSADCGVIEYFNRLKIEEAKTMIRRSDLQFTQIAEQLGYSSIHYFSRQFRQITGLSPTEYAESIKAMSE